MTRKNDPCKWHLSLGLDGYYVIDEHGEDIGFAGGDYAHAKRALDEMIREEITAQQEDTE